MPSRAGSGNTSGELIVTYDRGALNGSRTTASVESSLGLQTTRELDFNAIGTVAHIVNVDPARIDSVMRTLKSTPGVRSVSRTSYRHRLSAAALTVNDPYYNGFTGTTGPFFEAAGTPGQWDMHVIDVAQAWGYSQANNFNGGVAGAKSGAPIAVIDTGMDLTHAEFASGKVTRAFCYVTFSGSSTNGPFVTDFDGHGTNVAGIAAADTNNNFGFVGVGFNSHLLLYRIFPEPLPNGGCELPANANNPQCGADTADEASAIQDAVSHGAKVISLSLGGTPNAGQTCLQSDPVEANAVENAIASGVVVVAAAGNEAASTIDCPAGNVGVIAVGASALDDTNPASPVEKIASYSNFAAAGGNWGLVAPGGDPNGGNDADDLHWIEHIYSSTSLQPSSCTGDFNNPTGPGDCRILIAGTSQATPHVAGAAALLLGIGVAPANVFSMLCSTADSIGAGAKQGCGRLNVYHALAKALGDNNP